MRYVIFVFLYMAALFGLNALQIPYDYYGSMLIGIVIYMWVFKEDESSTVDQPEDAA
ncbi:hypothetical protein [Metapseudomonas otitidis]|uniref:hypothetical protein n=1 Tax=Metapseudomonas otitidis TaxID=319939 RepID=UPI00244A8642|nr:hypothetical protein [Pseudomonas otitidis]MDG9780284.1 hypothetical protein [Pseudomonas otitidis]